MKKTMLILCAVALVLIVLCLVLLGGLLTGLGAGSGPARGQGMEDYLSQRWPLFTLRSWDEDSGALELEYPLRFSYAQMEKYGGTLEELQQLPTGNLETVAALKTAARESAGLEIRAVTVYGVTNDGQIAYTVYPDGTAELCWEAD